MKKHNFINYMLISILLFLASNIVCMPKIIGTTNISVKPLQYMNKVICANLEDIKVGSYTFPIPIGAKESDEYLTNRRNKQTIYNLFYGMHYNGEVIVGNNDEDYGVFFCGGATNQIWFGNDYCHYEGLTGRNEDAVVYSNPTAQIFFSKIGVAKAKGILSDDVKQYLIYAPSFDTNEAKAQLDEIMQYINSHQEMWHYAEEECNKYCKKCSDNGYAYACNDYNLKDNYYALDSTMRNYVSDGYGKYAISGDVRFNVQDYNRPSLAGFTVGWAVYYENTTLGIIGEAIDESKTVLPAQNKCINYLRTSSETAGTRRYWLCEDKLNCVASCEGTCVRPPDFHEYMDFCENTSGPSKARPEMGNRNTWCLQNYIDLIKESESIKPYLCYGTKKKNVVFPNGDSTEDLKYYTSDATYVYGMQGFNGDNIPASLANIYKVGTGKITCTGIFGGGKLAKVLRDVFKYTRIVGVALFTIFSTLDFIKAISSSEQSPFKIVTKNLTSRFITLLILLILPTLINIILSIIEIKNSLCFLD